MALLADLNHEENNTDFFLLLNPNSNAVSVEHSVYKLRHLLQARCKLSSTAEQDLRDQPVGVQLYHPEVELSGDNILMQHGRPDCAPYRETTEKLFRQISTRKPVCLRLSQESIVENMSIPKTSNRSKAGVCGTVENDGGNPTVHGYTVRGAIAPSRPKHVPGIRRRERVCHHQRILAAFGNGKQNTPIPI